MCGIAGILSLDGSNVINHKKNVGIMLKQMENRGPDGSGIIISKNNKLVLGNNRLSIVGILDNIQLPFEKNSNHIMSFNGEIYNFKSLKEELIIKGISFQTNTDTEVLFELIKYYDLNAFKKLNGMWGVSFYDNDNNKLILSRDLLGERNIFYTIEKNKLIFGSTAKAVLSVLENPEYDFISSANCLMYGSPKPEETIIKNIKKLRAGYNLIVENSSIKIKKHSDLEPQNYFSFINKNINDENIIIEKFFDLMSNSLEERIPNEAKFCFSLSGGLDSSLNCMIASDVLKKEFEGYFMGGNKNEVDGEMTEDNASNYIADKYSIKLNKFNFNDNESIESLDKLSNNCFDGCIDDGIASFTILANKVKQKNNKVIIMSDGPDELLGGYKIDFEHYISDHKILDKEGNYKNKILSEFNSRVAHQIHKIEFLKLFFNSDLIYKIRDSFSKIDNFEIYNLPDKGSIRSLNYAKKSIPDHYNLRMDRSFMDNSVEVRQPFLDKKIVEYMIALPSYFRFSENNSSKFIMRKLIDKNFDRIISKRSKYGYSDNLWKNSNVFKELRINDQIGDSSFFSNENFNKNIKTYLLSDKCPRGIKWSSLALQNTYEKMKTIRKDSQALLS